MNLPKFLSPAIIVKHLTVRKKNTAASSKFPSVDDVIYFFLFCSIVIVVDGVQLHDQFLAPAFVKRLFRVKNKTDQRSKNANSNIRG